MSTFDLVSKIESKIVELQKEKCETRESIRRMEEETLLARKSVLVGIIELLDFCGQVENDSVGPSIQKISRKLSDLLKRNNVQEVVQSRVEPGLVRVIETRSEPQLDEGAVLAVCRKGYKLGDVVLRPVEVIANRR